MHLSKRNGSDVLFIGVNVDNVIAVHGCTDAGSLYHKFHERLHTGWTAEDEGELSNILNVNITTEGTDVLLNQAAYIKKMVKRYILNPADIKPF